MTSVQPPVPFSSPAPSAWWRSFNRHHWLVFSVASLAWLFDCLDAQFFNLARDGAMERLLIDPTKATVYAPYTTSVFLVGWAIGGLVFGALGDRYGRVRMLTVTILLYSVSTGLNAFATGLLDFCVYRIVTGLGMGGVFGLAVALVADSVPDRARAPALGMLQSLSTVGNLAAGFIGLGVGAWAVNRGLPFALRPWQALFLLGALPALLCVLVIRRLPEPDTWVRARASGDIRGVKFGSYGALLRDRRWRTNAWLGLVACTVGIVGLWGIGNFHPKIVGSIIETELASRHLGAEAMAAKKAYWRAAGLLLQNIGGFLGMLSLAKIAQVKGRRFALAISFVLSFATTVLVFRFMRTTTDMYWMLPAMGFGQLSVLSVYAVYLPELFPISLRSTGTSFCYNAGRIVAATAPFTLSRLTQGLGGDVAGFRLAGQWVSLVLLLGIAVVPFLPETKDRALPIDD